MTQTAKQWLRHKTRNGTRINFYIARENGGIAGSLTHLGHTHRADTLYTLTRQGSRWIGVEPASDCPA